MTTEPTSPFCEEPWHFHINNHNHIYVRMIVLFNFTNEVKLSFPSNSVNMKSNHTLENLKVGLRSILIGPREPQRH